MFKFYRIGILFVLLVVASQLIFGLEDDIHRPRLKRSFSAKNGTSVIKIMGKLPGYFKDAVTLWQTFEQVHDMFAATPRFQKVDTEARITALNSKVDKLISDVKTFKQRVLKVMADKYDIKSVEAKLEKISNEMELINKVYYARFIEYTNSTLNLETYAIQLAINVAKNSILETSLVLIKSNLLASLLDTSGTYNNILYLLADPNLVNEFMCARHKSAQQSIYSLYEQVMLTEVRAYLMSLFSINLVNEIFQAERSVDTIKKEFIDRMKEIYAHVKMAMAGASREVWRCDQHFVEGETYSMLKPIFQKYILHEGETYVEPTSRYAKVMETDTEKLGCEKNCPTITGLKQTQCNYYMCRHAKSKMCTGVLQDCEFKQSEMIVCPSDNSSYRHYEYIRTGGGDFYGVKNDCQQREVTGENSILPSWYYCDVCLCTCDSSMNEDFGVSIDLRPVVTDLENHKVITGMKIVYDKTIRLEIIEGQLLPGGRINSSTVELKTLKNSHVQNQNYDDRLNYARITWERRTICLDDLKSVENDEVLTGVKFELDKDNRIQLAIRLTRFNFITGELVPTETKWISQQNSPNAAKRSKLSIKNLDIPKGSDMNVPRSESGQCFEIHTSGLEQDAGQTVVPFIDIQPLVTNPPMPMSGAGLFLRGNDDIAGFLTPKLFTLDLEPHTHKLKTDD